LTSWTWFSTINGRYDEGSPADHIEVILTFELDDADRSVAEEFTAADGHLFLRKVFSTTSNETFYKGQKFVDERLHQNFGGMTATQLDLVLEELGIKYEGRPNKEKRLELIEEHKRDAPTREDWIPIQSAKMRDLLPRFERYRAIDYQSPESLVRKTLQTVYESAVFETGDGGQRQPVESLRAFLAGAQSWPVPH
jgi:hypothetical protein